MPASQIADVQFEELVRLHHRDLLRVAYAMSGDRALAEDAVQSCWDAAWRSRASIRDSRRMVPWLYVVTGNNVKRALRRRRLGDLAAMRLRGPSRETDIDPRFIDLRRALARMTLGDRELIGMRYGIGLSSEEIGQRLGLSGTGVRRRLQGAIARLRKELEV